MGSRMERTCCKAVAGGPGEVAAGRVGGSHICVQINQEEQLGSETDCTTQGSSVGNKASKPLIEKTCGGCGSGRNFQTYRRDHWRDPQGARMYTNPPIQQSVQFARG